MFYVYSTAKVKEFKGDKKLSLNPDLEGIVSESSDPEELQYYWDQWRRATGERMGDQYRQYIDLYNEAATLNGFRCLVSAVTRALRSALIFPP